MIIPATSVLRPSNKCLSLSLSRPGEAQDTGSQNRKGPTEKQSALGVSRGTQIRLATALCPRDVVLSPESQTSPISLSPGAT